MYDFEILMFDLDGTLVDSSKDIVKCTNHMLKKIGYPCLGYEEIISRVGNGAGELVAEIIGEKGTDFHAEALDIFRSYLAGEDEFESVLYPGILDFLIGSSAKKKYVVTNRPIESAELTLQRLGIRDFFVQVHGGTRDLTRLKPSPYMVKEVIKHSGVNPERSVMIGDTEVDIQVAANAGVRSCAVSYGFFSRDYLEGFSPDIIIDSPADLHILM